MSTDNPGTLADDIARLRGESLAQFAAINALIDALPAATRESFQHALTHHAEAALTAVLHSHAPDLTLQTFQGAVQAYLRKRPTT